MYRYIADRIQVRAVHRLGELLKEFDRPGKKPQHRCFSKADGSGGRHR
jgi:hypothetical protein